MERSTRLREGDPEAAAAAVTAPAAKPALLSDDRLMPSQAEVVVIGGGVAGTSIAYHLAKNGQADVVLVDQADLASGTTFHSAGVVGQIRESLAWTRMMPGVVSGYRQLKDETGVDPSWHGPGSVRLASTRERLDELKRQVLLARAAGLEMELISPAEAHGQFPLMSTDGVLAAGFLRGDGWIDPSGLTLAFAAGARKRGVRLFTQTRVDGIQLRDRSVAGVSTSRGYIRTERVVNAAGVYAREIARFVGVNLPIVAFEHQYLVTQPVAEIVTDLPVVRDPENLLYFRSDANALLLGGYELEPVPWGLNGIPGDFNARLLPPDWSRFETLIPGALRRLPGLDSMGVARLVNGPDAYTPDHEFILGEADVRGFFVAAGFNSQGVGPAGIVGQMMAAWIIDGDPPMDVTSVDVMRFGSHHRSRALAVDRAREKLAARFVFHYPHERQSTGQPLRRSPAFPRLEILEAVFSEHAGWGCPDWFGSNQDQAADALRPDGISGLHWSSAVATEAWATRTAAGLYDRTASTKIEVSGAGALPLLQFVCSNDMDRPIGSVTYALVLNGRGGVEWDLTATRLSSDRFLLVTAPELQTTAWQWLSRHRPSESPPATISDVTSSYARFCLWGPAVEKILLPLIEADISDQAFPYLTGRDLTCGPVPALAIRRGSPAVQGWELYAPSEYGLTLWDLLMAAGHGSGLRPAGHLAADSLRVESGHLAFGLDLTADTTPLAAGIEAVVRLDTEHDFVGKEALLRRTQEPIHQRLTHILLRNPRIIAGKDDPVRIGGRPVGHVTSGAYGFATGESIAFAYMPTEFGVTGTTGEVWAEGSWVPFEVSAWPGHVGKAGA